MLLIDPYVDDLRLELQHFGDAEVVAIDDGIVRSLKELRRGNARGERIRHEDGGRGKSRRPLCLNRALVEEKPRKILPRPP
jgi:hypothetical protein